ncbi:hypothetical protein A5N15_05175 [Rothia kristinae]|uniref:Uncharacterized protein n=1 Tax=Rothia kristinae TaxID=37923 RepID=A0A657IUN7_9MICC|nr:hypothetical protein A5N15_05175 [Rothia kristinae]
MIEEDMMDFADLVNEFAVSARDNLRGPGQREAALAAPVAELMRGVGEMVGHRVVAHNEVTVTDDVGEAVRPTSGSGWMGCSPVTLS